MGDNTNWISTLQSGLTHLLDVFLNYLPQIIGATVLMLLGWVAAALLRMITMRAARGVGWFLPRVLPGAAAARLRTTLQPRLLGALVFWLVILAAAGAAAQVLGLEIFASWLDAVFSRLPQLVLALLIVAAGVGLSHVTRAGVVRAAAAGGLENRALLGYSVQAIILAAAAAIALDVVGLDITFLVVLVAILLGAVSGGAALAFGLGSRVFVSNLLGVGAVQHRFKVNDAIRIGELEGRVVELDRHAVVLETADGLVAVPGKYFGEQPFTLLIREDDHHG